MHPLKNVNVWGDGGVVVTGSDKHADKLRKLRNHGMSDRNTCEFWGYNSRLDTVQAVVARHVLARIADATRTRRTNATYLRMALSDIPQIELPEDADDTEPNYYLFSFHAERREALQAFLVAHGVDAKVHYPTPLHLQPAAKSIGDFKRGDFPVAEWCADTTLSLPVHEWVNETHLDFMAARVRQFYEEL
jgi:dTDP-4-amino-4,6-dideoxygalactose transaminase